MLIAALFRVANTLKQPKCPSKEEWIKKMSAIKKNETMSFVAT